MQRQIPLDEGHIMWIKHQLLDGRGAGEIATTFLKDHPDFQCKHGSLRFRIKKIHEEMCRRRNVQKNGKGKVDNDVQKNGKGKVDNDPGSPWTTKETKCLNNLLSFDYLSWTQRAVLFNDECNSSRTGTALRQHHRMMQKERQDLMQKERQDFDEFMDVIKNMPTSEKERQDFDHFGDLLVDFEPLPDTTWNPYQEPC